MKLMFLFILAYGKGFSAVRAQYVINLDVFAEMFLHLRHLVQYFPPKKIGIKTISLSLNENNHLIEKSLLLSNLSKMSTFWHNICANCSEVGSRLLRDGTHTVGRDCPFWLPIG